MRGHRLRKGEENGHSVMRIGAVTSAHVTERRAACSVPNTRTQGGIPPDTRCAAGYDELSLCTHLLGQPLRRLGRTLSQTHNGDAFASSARCSVSFGCCSSEQSEETPGSV